MNNKTFTRAWRPLTAKGKTTAVSGHPTIRALRILHVLFSSKIAGSERYCADLANGQADLGHEVHVAGNYGAPITSLLSKDVIFHGLRSPFLRGMKLRRLITGAAIEIGHAHLGPACRALASAPDHVTKIATLHVGFKERQHARLDGVICVNSTQITRLGGYAGHAQVISNWLPANTNDSALDLRSRLGLRPGIKIIGAVGRLHPSKGFDMLVSAFRKSAPDDAVLVIVGEGSHRAALAKMAAGDSRIHLPGHCDNVTGFLGCLDVFVSPSREETFGLAILEAMREGLPVITTATEGPSEYLRHYPVTFVEPGSADNLSRALADALRPQRIVGAGSVVYDLSPFSRSTGVANVLDFYWQVANAAGKPVTGISARPMLTNAW